MSGVLLSALFTLTTSLDDTAAGNSGRVSGLSADSAGWFSSLSAKSPSAGSPSAKSLSAKSLSAGSLFSLTVRSMTVVPAKRSPSRCRRGLLAATANPVSPGTTPGIRSATAPAVRSAWCLMEGRPPSSNEVDKPNNSLPGVRPPVSVGTMSPTTAAATMTARIVAVLTSEPRPLPESRSANGRAVATTRVRSTMPARTRRARNVLEGLLPIRAGCGALTLSAM